MTSFAESCRYFDAEPRPEVIFLLGHWSQHGLGCPVGMSTPEVYGRVALLAGCDRGTLRYVMGHTHCNKVAATVPASVYPSSSSSSSHGIRSAAVGRESVGYLIGGAGVRGDFMGCNTFGFGYFQTSAAGDELMVGFDLANETHDQFDETLKCFVARGVGQCLEFGTIWRNTTGRGTAPL
jgi:hypothetical protein